MNNNNNAQTISAAATLVDYPSFRLSRAYAQGWNAARRLPADADPKNIAALNPHKSEPERTRWAEGFSKASE